MQTLNKFVYTCLVKRKTKDVCESTIKLYWVCKKSIHSFPFFVNIIFSLESEINLLGTVLLINTIDVWLSLLGKSSNLSFQRDFRVCDKSNSWNDASFPFTNPSNKLRRRLAAPLNGEKEEMEQTLTMLSSTDGPMKNLFELSAR